MGAPMNLALARPYDNLGSRARMQDLVDLTMSVPSRRTPAKLAALVLRNVPGGPFDGTSAVDAGDLARTRTSSRSGIGDNDILGAVGSRCRRRRRDA